MNNFLTVQHLKMALKKQTFHNILLKAFLSDTPQSIKRQNKELKEQDGKYIPINLYGKYNGIIIDY